MQYRGRCSRQSLWFLLSLSLLAAPALTQASGETLSDAYSAILRGDYSTGRSEIARLIETGGKGEDLRRVDTWLESFQGTVQTRCEMRAQTLAWNVAQAQKALSAGKTYLALCFAAQGVAYADGNGDALRSEPWLQELRDVVLKEAEVHEERARWSKALSFYSRLERLWPKDVDLREKRKRAASHARLEAAYKDRQAVKERTQGISEDMLNQALRQIKDKYYQEPDFRKMAHGALDELAALCETTKLFDVFDSIANADLREHFLAGIERLRERVRTRETFDVRDLLTLYREVAELNRQSIELKREMLVMEFLEGAVGALDDFTSIIWPADADDFDKAMIGQFRGVGIQLGKDEATDRLKVVTPLENSPALEAGIQPGDLIVEVDGVSTEGWTTENAVDKITGEEGTKVTLTIFRPSTNTRLEFPLKRRQIQLTTVRGVNRVSGESSNTWNYMLDPELGIAYIRLTGFNPDSQRELDHALRQAKKQGMRGLVLDLRHNPGGLLDIAVTTVSTFVRRGNVVSTQGRREQPQRLPVTGEATYADLPLVVLVNEGSASASEILAGALQDQNRAAVLGERTYGKGSVQRVLPLSEERARLKLTTALYYLPSGRSPHREPDAEKWGVDPDWEIKLTPKELLKVLERETKAFVIGPVPEPKPAPPAEKEPPQEKAASKRSGDESGSEEGELLSEEDWALLRADPIPAPDADPQLETALLQLRVKLLANLPWPREIATRTGDRLPPSP
jgi:carboxyl-terminal processing protease